MHRVFTKPQANAQITPGGLGFTLAGNEDATHPLTEDRLKEQPPLLPQAGWGRGGGATDQAHPAPRPITVDQPATVQRRGRQVKGHTRIAAGRVNHIGAVALAGAGDE